MKIYDQNHKQSESAPSGKPKQNFDEAELSKIRETSMFDADISMKSSFLADQIDQTTQNLKKLMPIIPVNDKNFNL